MTSALQRGLFTKRWRKVVVPQRESTFHIQLVTMLRWCLRSDVYFWHCPLGEYRDSRTAAKLKAMGAMPGVADLEFHWAEMEDGRKMRRVLHLELKTRNTKQSDVQIAFELAMKLLGDEYFVVRNVDEAIAILGERGLIKAGVTVCGKRWGSKPPQDFDPVADFAGSLDECYREIRERKAKGGPGWVPKEPSK